MIDFQALDLDDGFYKIKLADIADIEFRDMPENVVLHVIDDDFPECYISAEGKQLIIDIEFKITTDILNGHSVMAYAEAIVSAIAVEKMPIEHLSHADINQFGEETSINWSYLESRYLPWKVVFSNIKNRSMKIDRRAKKVLKGITR